MSTAEIQKICPWDHSVNMTVYFHLLYVIVYRCYKMKGETRCLQIDASLSAIFALHFSTASFLCLCFIALVHRSPTKATADCSRFPGKSIPRLFARKLLNFHFVWSAVCQVVRQTVLILLQAVQFRT